MYYYAYEFLFQYLSILRQNLYSRKSQPESSRRKKIADTLVKSLVCVKVSRMKEITAEGLIWSESLNYTPSSIYIGVFLFLVIT